MNKDFNGKMKWIKKVGIAVFSSLLLSSMIASMATAAGTSVNVVADGEKYPFSSVVPYVENNTTMVPLRFVSEKLGAAVKFDSKTNTVEVKKGDMSIVLTVASAVASVNGEKVMLDSKVVRQNGVTMVPLRFVSEVLSAQVKWDSLMKTAFITTPGKELTEVDPFGRKVRTLKLPSNYKDYPYILEDIPNEMYEMKYPRSIEGSQVSAEIYKSERFSTEDLNKIMSRMKAAYELKLNVDYRTIDPDAWAEDLYQYMNQAMGRVRYYQNKKYADWVKENKISIEGSIDPEPTMLYNSGLGGFYVRTKVRFKLNSYTDYKDVIYDTFFSNAGRLKKGVWYVGYADIELSSSVSGDLGENLNIGSFSSFFYNGSIREER